MTRKPAAVERQLVLEARLRSRDAEAHGQRSVTASELDRVNTIVGQRSRTLSASEIRQLREEKKRDKALLRAEFAKRGKPRV